MACAWSSADAIAPEGIRARRSAYICAICEFDHRQRLFLTGSGYEQRLGTARPLRPLVGAGEDPLICWEGLLNAMAVGELKPIKPSRRDSRIGRTGSDAVLASK
jgi:hypothetical protein